MTVFPKNKKRKRQRGRQNPGGTGRRRNIRLNEYSQEQIDRANAVNLVDFLRSQGEQLEKSIGDT